MTALHCGHRLSLVAVHERFLLWHEGFSGCGAWALEFTGSAAVATGSVVPRPVTSSWTGDWTWVPCIGRWSLKCWTTEKSFTVFRVSRHNRVFSQIRMSFIVFLSNLFIWPCGLWDLYSPTRDRSPPRLMAVKAPRLNPWTANELPNLNVRQTVNVFLSISMPPMLHKTNVY